jgi:hypothetical protein
VTDEAIPGHSRRILATAGRQWGLYRERGVEGMKLIELIGLGWRGGKVHEPWDGTRRKGAKARRIFGF